MARPPQTDVQGMRARGHFLPPWAALAADFWAMHLVGVQIAEGLGGGLHGQQVVAVGHRVDRHIVERHDARQMGNVGDEHANVVVGAAHTHERWAARHSSRAPPPAPGAKELELQPAADAGLVDVGQQGIHLGSVRQLLFQLCDVLPHLLQLLLQRVEGDGLGDLLRVFGAQLALAPLGSFERIATVGQPDVPQRHDDEDRHRHQQQPAAAPASGTDRWGPAR